MQAEADITNSFISGLSQLADRFDFVVCDVWGVIHNGRDSFPAALDCLRQLRAAGKIVVLLSNSPRPLRGLLPQLAALKVDDACFDAVVSSGEITRRRLLAQGAPERLYHLGPFRDRLIFEGFEDRLTATPLMADTIICTGLFDDRAEQIEDYGPLLVKPAAQGIPLICANPDRVVQVGDEIVPCAGALADLYQTLGGPIDMVGKPYACAYDACFEELARLSGARPDKARGLAIGDSLITDIAGAVDYGLAPLFIASGIHGHLADHPQALADTASRAGVGLPMIMRELAW